MKHLNQLFVSLKDVPSYHSAEFSAGELRVLKRLLEWPTEHSLAVLDATRVLMMHAAANAAIGEDAAVQEALLTHVREGKKSGKDTYQILMLKIVGNWIAKRQRHASER